MVIRTPYRIFDACHYQLTVAQRRESNDVSYLNFIETLVPRQQDLHHKNDVYCLKLSKRWI